MAHTVMVTGADGFIGSHLTEELVKRGEKVRAFCLYNSFGSLGWIDTLPPELRRLMRLRYLDGMTCEQVCVELPCSWDTFHRWHRKALAMLE